MVTFIPNQDQWGNAGRQAGAGLVEGYTNRADESALRKSMESLGQNASARDILDAITKTKTYNPESKQQVLRNYLGAQQFDELKRQHQANEEIAKAKNTIAQTKANREVEKEAREVQDADAIVNQLNIPDEQKESLKGVISKKEATGLLKDQLKPAKSEAASSFEKDVQRANAKEYVRLATEIPKIDSTLGDIAYVEKLINDETILGIPARSFGLSGQAAEAEAVGFTLIEPILKMLAPSGQIAAVKLKAAQDKYAIKSYELPWIKKAKLRALKRFANQAKARGEQKLDLIKKYDGKPPPYITEEFDRQSEMLSDAMIDADLTGEDVTQEGMPDAAQFKGKTVTSPQGIKFFSDGTKWVKK